jgi:dTDP-4-dehydrorhamnose reductase
MRISLTGGTSRTGDRGFNEELKNAWRAGRALDLFTDEYRCPMPVEVPAKAVWELALKNARGLYHLNGAEKLSRFQIGELLAARRPDLNPKIIAGCRKDYKGPPRPADTSFNCAKIKKMLSFEIPAFSGWLQEHPSDPF